MRLLPAFIGLLGVSLTGICAALLMEDVLSPVVAADAAPTVAERVQRARDELDIMELEVDYGRRLDNRDFDGYAANFAETGVMHSGLGSAKGHAAIKEMLIGAFGEPGPVTETVSSIHLMTNPLIDINGDTATGTVKYTYIVTGEDGMPQLRIAAHYRDRYIRENGEWKIRERESNPDILPANPMED